MAINNMLILLTTLMCIISSTI